MKRRKAKERIGTTSRDAVFGLLGLAARAGHVVIGTEQVRSLAEQGRVRFAVVAADLTTNGRRRIVPKLEHRRVPYVEWGTRAELGESVGRGPTGALGLTDLRVAERIRALLEESSVC